jgi:hypothetical protein
MIKPITMRAVCSPPTPAAFFHTQRVDLGQNGPHHHHLISLTCSRHDRADKLLNWRYTTITHSLSQYGDVFQRCLSPGTTHHKARFFNVILLLK